MGSNATVLALSISKPVLVVLAELRLIRLLLVNVLKRVDALSVRSRQLRQTAFYLGAFEARDGLSTATFVKIRAL
ncbi:MAG: hypothetical protein Q9180_005780, partial [Flavoplaca navasiana]